MVIIKLPAAFLASPKSTSTCISNFEKRQSDSCAFHDSGIIDGCRQHGGQCTVILPSTVIIDLTALH
ncbi:hypothetical protein CHS0354_023003 [Potamilus streckersoni]|uniref:Uncharacterized protein n=1 Tax=Potamilus streckersoni TaxID=2493646 RepID=A0AAE0SV13_9BIVA|nr:hypothetical protein CHS0354_023003 [Potamilus streckersoni]